MLKAVLSGPVRSITVYAVVTTLIFIVPPFFLHTSTSHMLPVL